MRRVRRSLSGVAAFLAEKDFDVVKIEMQLSGLRFSETGVPPKYFRYFSLFNELALNLKLIRSLYVYDVVAYYKSKPVLCRFYISKIGKRVKYVFIAAFQPGIIRKVAPLLSKMGWKRLFLFEMAATKSFTSSSHKF